MKNLAKKVILSRKSQLFANTVVEQATPTSQPLKFPIFIISVLGTVLEYFEYAIYGFLAPILANHFFSNDDPTTSLIKTFGVFAVGSLSKPLGALLFGYLGDIRGRKISLRYSMVGISFPTFIVGILPGYDTWGLVAAACLILCRMFQGIFIAGESDGVRIYVYEHFGNKYPCFITSLVSCGAYLGIALASFVSAHIPSTDETWRFAFLGCSFFGAIVFILRRFLVETPPFLAYLQKHLSPKPIKNIIHKQWRPLLRTIMICGAGGGTYHFYIIFQGIYLSKILNLASATIAAHYSFWLTCLNVLFLPIAGLAADRWGLRRMGITGGILSLSLAFTNVLLILKGTISFPLMLFTKVALVFFLAPHFIYLAQQYAVDVRFRCLSLGHTVGSMLFSGTTPVVCLFLLQFTQLKYAPYFYFLLLITMGIIGFMWKGNSQPHE